MTSRAARDWRFRDIASDFDGHVREQLPWYDLATRAAVEIARHYIPAGGLVFDIGTGTGNIPRALEPVLAERRARLRALESDAAMAARYRGLGRPIRADAARYPFPPFDVAILFLTVMFLPVSRRRDLMRRLRARVRAGGAIIVFDRMEAPAGYAATVLARLCWSLKLSQGVTPGAVVEKELALAGVQRPITDKDLAGPALQVFRFGDFAGWPIEAG